MQFTDGYSDKLLESAISYLVDGQKFNEANLLLLCELSIEDNAVYPELEGPIYTGMVDVELLGSRAVYEIIQDAQHPSTIEIKRALEAVLPVPLLYLTSRVVYTNFNSEWRIKLSEAVRAKVPLNQGVPYPNEPIFSWEGLNYRSPCEMRIAKALEEQKLLFFPNCRGRFCSPNSQERTNREPDFLVCCEGKWGIIEVDGDTFHTNKAKDDDRDRLFKAHRIKVIEHYSKQRCIDDPRGVVQDFLHLLKMNG